MLKILICDDSPKEGEALRDEILKCCGDRVGSVSLFQKKESLKFYLEDNDFEPAILMIDLNFCKDGIGLAEKAKQLNPWIQIIFLVNQGNMTLDVYDVDHIYSLEEPLNLEKLKVAFQKAIQKIDENRRELIPIRKRGITYAIPLKKIEYIEKDRRLVHLYMGAAKHSVYAKFEDLKKYKRDYFVRCHNSYVVNLIHVENMEDQHFLLKNGRKVPISRSRCKEAKESYLSFLMRSPLEEKL
jgi:two-component system response regulator LytT